MDDLIPRLRKAADHYALQPWPKASPVTAAEFHEAADEIVSLRSALERIANWLETSGGKLSRTQVHEMVQFARSQAALGGW